MTDKMQESYPEKAVEWFLEMKHAIDAILRFGARNQELEYVAFCGETLYSITSRLPYGLETKAYELQGHGRSRLEQVKRLIEKDSGPEESHRHVQHEPATNFNLNSSLSRAHHALPNHRVLHALSSHT